MNNKEVDFHVIIPARYQSQRLPGKVLMDIAGKPMLQHVYESALASEAQSVVIATDHEKVYEKAKSFGADVCMTSTSHTTGTDRIEEVVRRLGYTEEDIIVNVQGDKPLLQPALIKQVALELFENDQADVSTLCLQIQNTEMIFDPNIVKVIRDKAGLALYFSRAPIPWDRASFHLKDRNNINIKEHSIFQHIGLYAYSVGFLHEYVTWPAAPIETVEKLEQLRVLWHQRKIYVGEAVEEDPPGVDTLEELEKVRACFKA